MNSSAMMGGKDRNLNMFSPTVDSHYIIYVKYIPKIVKLVTKSILIMILINICPRVMTRIL